MGGVVKLARTIGYHARMGRRRTIRLAKWAGVGLCVVVAVAWVVSMFVTFGIDRGPTFSVKVKSGMLIALQSYWLTDQGFEGVLYSAGPRGLYASVLDGADNSLPVWIDPEVSPRGR